MSYILNFKVVVIISSRWYGEFEITSSKIKKIRNYLIDTYDFDGIMDDEEDEDVLFIHKNTLSFEGEEGYCFYDYSGILPSVEDLFIAMLKR